MNVSLSVVIPTYNRAYQLDNCLTSLFKQNYPQRKYEVIIIDDNSYDETRKVTNKYSKKYSNLKVIKNKKNMGPYYGRNLGAKLSKSPIVVFTDDDCNFPLSWLMKIEKSFQNQKISCVQGTQKYGGKDPSPEAEDEFYIEMLKKRNGLDTKNLAIRRDLILKHKFNERIRVTGDAELGLRLALNHVMIKYDPNIWVNHSPNYSFKDRISRAKNWGIDYAIIHQTYGWNSIDSRFRYPFPLLFFFYLGSSLYFLFKDRSFQKTITFVLMLLIQSLYFKITLKGKKILLHDRTILKKQIGM